jgi:hypothetical protein
MPAEAPSWSDGLSFRGNAFVLIINCAILSKLPEKDAAKQGREAGPGSQVAKEFLEKQGGKKFFI